MKHNIKVLNGILKNKKILKYNIFNSTEKNKTMKVSIFIDNFYHIQAEKDPGLIGVFLSKKHEVTYYCLNTDMSIFQNITIKKITKKNAKSDAFWKNEQNDIIIFYSWLSLKFSKIIRAIKNNNIKLILKMDSDGHLIFPLRPTYLKSGLKNYYPKNLLLFLIRKIQWFIFPRAISRRKIRQIENSDAVIIESPRALTNLQSSLKYWGAEKLNEKIFFVPNQISLPKNNQTNEKENIILSVGRWDDKRKNAKAIYHVLKDFNFSNKWRFILIGNGSKIIRDKVIRKNKNLKIDSFENLPHNEIIELTNKAKIFFAPSICESFGLAAAEALGGGCSLAGTPLESFEYLTNNSKFGTLSKNFSITEIKKALNKDIVKWENNSYDTDAARAFINENLNTETVGVEIEKIIKKL